jgi:hypothetical protein
MESVSNMKNYIVAILISFIIFVISLTDLSNNLFCGDWLSVFTPLASATGWWLIVVINVKCLIDLNKKKIN